MFNCITGHTAGPKTKKFKLVTERRERNYSNDKFVEITSGFRRQETVISKGWEIVKEVDICKECLDKRNSIETIQIKHPTLGFAGSLDVIKRDERQMNMSAFIN